MVTGGYTFSGQACVSVQRVYVEEPVAEEFTAMLAAAVEKLRSATPGTRTRWSVR